MFSIPDTKKRYTYALNPLLAHTANVLSHGVHTTQSTDPHRKGQKPIHVVIALPCRGHGWQLVSMYAMPSVMYIYKSSHYFQDFLYQFQRSL